MWILKRDLWNSCLPGSVLIERDAAADVEGRMSCYGCILSTAAFSITTLLSLCLDKPDLQKQLCIPSWGGKCR